MLKELKEGMMTMPYQMQNINKETELLKRTKQKIWIKKYENQNVKFTRGAQVQI